jgi:phosphopantetheine adenylyltransferase
MSHEISTEHTQRKIEAHLDQIVLMLNDVWDPISHTLRMMATTGGGVTPTVPPFVPHDPPPPDSPVAI